MSTHVRSSMLITAPQFLWPNFEKVEGGMLL